MLHALSTIAEINAELAAGTATIEQVVAVLTPRVSRPSRSGANARAWLVSHGVIVVTVGTAVATTTPRTVVQVPKGTPAKAAKAAKAVKPGHDDPELVEIRQAANACWTKGMGKLAGRTAIAQFFADLRVLAASA